MEEKKGIKINAYSIISILTLVVMGIGSTFAYFNAQMSEVKSDSISVSSINLVVNLKIEPLYTELKILPTKDSDIYKAFDNKCLDYVGNGACIAYTIDIENIGQPQSGYLTFKYESEDIRNLKFLILDGDDNSKVLQEPTLATSEDIVIGDAIKMESNQVKKVIIVLWISEQNKPQDYEQGGTFTGIVSYNSALGARVTGTMNKNVLIGN